MSSNKYMLIAESIENRIYSKQYLPHSKLPAHRLLADEFSTTPATVAKAYKVLINKELIESSVGKGTFVCARSDLDQAIQAPEDESHYNFSILQPCLYKNLPALKQAMQKVNERLSAKMIGYTEHSGHEAHRLAAVKWAKHFGLQGGTSNNTLLTDGAQHALYLLMLVMTKPGDTIAVEALTYPGILAIANLSGRKVIPLALDEQGVCPHALHKTLLQAQPKLVIIIPSHQNPTGITMPEKRRHEIAKVIAQHPTWLVEDDIYCFLDESPIAPISNLIPAQSFHISGLSKAISPALRCGYIKAPDSQVTKINTYIRANIWLSSPMNHMLASELIESGEAFNIAQLQRQTALERQAIAHRILPNVQNSPSGYHIWLALPAHWPRERFLVEAGKRDIIVSSGSYFSVAGEDSDFIRLSLMAINSEEKLKQGLTALKELLLRDMSANFSF